MDQTMATTDDTGEGTSTPHRGDPWRRLLSARVRILAWVVLLLALAGGATLLLQRRVLLARLDDEVDSGLRQERAEVERLASGRDPNTGQPFGGNVAAIFDTFFERNIPTQGEVLLSFVGGEFYKATASPHSYRLEADVELMSQWAQMTRSARGEVSTPEGEVRYSAVPLAEGDAVRGIFVVAYFLQEERQEITRTMQVGAAVYSSVLIVAIGVAWFIAGRVLRPVRDITETAKHLTDTDLSRRIPVPDSDDEIAELARTFNAMLDRLDGAFRHQREFLNDAGHELRTPITIIRGYLEVEGDDPEERNVVRPVLLDELSRMTRIVDDLLILAQSEQPDFLQREAVDLDLLTTDLVSKAAALGDRDWQLVDTGHAVILADRHRITQAMVNLLDNAVRHTVPGDRIELGSSLQPGGVRLWVRDFGPGVPYEDQERIFRRFARANNGRGEAGTAGLGLAIVRAIAEAHGGLVEIHSRPGDGSVFTVSLPVPDLPPD